MDFQIFHGSSEPITEIRSDGIFGGLFGTPERAAAASHGGVVHVIESPNHLSDYALNYEIEDAYDFALTLADGNEDVANAIMSKACEALEDCDPEDVAEQGWKFQRMRGALAARLGYTSVEMLDEHGTTYLCLPGCSIRVGN